MFTILSHIFLVNMPKRHRQPENAHEIEELESSRKSGNDDLVSRKLDVKRKSQNTRLTEAPCKKNHSFVPRSKESSLNYHNQTAEESEWATRKEGHAGISVSKDSSSSSLSDSLHEESMESRDSPLDERDKSKDNSFPYGSDEESHYEASEESDEDNERDDNSEFESDEDSLSGENDEDENGEERFKESNITVNFEVYDMEKRHADAVAHLIDQFCPDSSQKEVDRSSFAEALMESPYTSIVKMNDGDGEEEEEAVKKAFSESEGEEEEVCGMCSVIHFFNCLSRHPASFKPLEKLLSENVWRTWCPGINPLDLLRSRKQESPENTNNTSVKTSRDSYAGMNMKALLWIFEHIQTTPMELTTQLMIDTLSRLEKDSKNLMKEPRTSSVESVHEYEAAVCFPCLFVVLAKVQRGVSSELNPPISSEKAKKEKGKKDAKGSQSASSAESVEGQDFVLKDYVFWREEDELLFTFRDRRVAVLAYRCRPQYDGQPEMDIPLTLMFAVQNGAAHQVAEELKKRAVAPSEVTRFR